MSLFLALPFYFNFRNIYQIVIYFHWIQAHEIFSITTRIFATASATYFNFC